MGITCSSVGLSTRFFILIICIILLTSLVLVLLLSSLFLFIKMLKNSKHAQNLMAFIYNCLSITLFQEDSVHFPPELTDPALLAEVNHFIIQRSACSSLKRHSHHYLRLFLQQVSQGNSLLYFAIFVQVVSFKPSPDPRVKEVTSIQSPPFSHAKIQLQLEDCDGLPTLAPPVREFKVAKIQVKPGCFLLN